MGEAHVSFIYTDRIGGDFNELRYNIALHTGEIITDLTIVLTAAPHNSAEYVGARYWRPFKQYTLYSPGPSHHYPKDTFPSEDLEKALKHLLSPWSTIMVVEELKELLEQVRMDLQAFMLNQWGEDQSDFGAAINGWVQDRALTFEVAP